MQACVLIVFLLDAQLVIHLEFVQRVKMQQWTLRHVFVLQINGKIWVRVHALIVLLACV